MAHEGFFVVISTKAPHETHTHYGQSVGYIEFLENALGPGATRCREEECKRYSTFLGMLIEAYTLGEHVIFFTEFLFSAEDAALFVKVYMQDNFKGLMPTLRDRSAIDLRGYVRGRIALSLDTDLAVNGRLEVNFSLEGIVSLPYLYEARMHYTSPKPGNFKRVEVDTSIPSIFFYIDE